MNWEVVVLSIGIVFCVAISRFGLVVFSTRIVS